MKLRKEHAVIIFLLVAFIVFFVNAIIVLGNKNAKIHDLEEKNRKLHSLHEALTRDHEDLRREKVQIMERLNEAMKQSAREPEEEDSPDKR